MTPAQTPERPVTWSDEELRKAGNTADRTYWMDNWSLRWMRPFLAALGAVHPHEAREREREAWDECWYWATAEATKLNGGRGHASDRPSERARDERYPPLPPKSPPPLVLSVRTWVRGPDGTWSLQGGGAQWNMPLCATASDAEKLATWLRAYGSTEEAK